MACRTIVEKVAASSVHPCSVPPAGSPLGVAVTAGERAVRSTRCGGRAARWWSLPSGG